MLRPSIIYYIVLMEQSIYKIMEQSENSEIELNYLGLTEFFSDSDIKSNSMEERSILQ